MRSARAAHTKKTIPVVMFSALQASLFASIRSLGETRPTDLLWLRSLRLSSRLASAKIPQSDSENRGRVRSRRPLPFFCKTVPT